MLSASSSVVLKDPSTSFEVEIRRPREPLTAYRHGRTHDIRIRATSRCHRAVTVRSGR